MKQRLIGALVLVAIGVIAWTVIFDPSQVDRFSRRSEIPPAPEFERVEVPRAEPVSDLRTVDYEELNREQVREQTTAGATSEPAEPPAPSTQVGSDTEALPALWAVQVGSFGEYDNARKLKERLEAAGYHVIVQNVAADSGQMTRLFVDPKLDRRSAERLQGQLDGKFGTRSVVVRYYPG